MKLKIHIMLLIVFVVFAGGAVGQNVRSMAPNGTGLSNERLERITAVMNDHVAKGHIAGAIGLIARRGKVGYFETYGFQDKEAANAVAFAAVCDEDGEEMFVCGDCLRDNYMALRHGKRGLWRNQREGGTSGDSETSIEGDL